MLRLPLAQPQLIDSLTSFTFGNHVLELAERVWYAGIQVLEYLVDQQRGFVGVADGDFAGSRASGDPRNPVLIYAGDSDALIVKGLIAIAFMLFSGRGARDILATDAVPLLRELGLDAHLTPQRSNGFASMIGRIKADARAALQVSPAAGMAGR